MTVHETLGRPLRADAERNRRRILAAAAEVFAKRGLDAGLDEIARHAGVGTGTVYRRFPDKTLLIDALFDHRIDELLELAQTGLAADDSWTGLVYYLERSIEMQQADRGLMDVLFGGTSGTNAQPGATSCARVNRLLPAISALVDRAKCAGQLRSDVTVTDFSAIQFMLNGLGVLAAGVEPDLWRRQLGLLLDGLRAQRSGTTTLPLAPLSLEQLQAICMPKKLA
jgi:AcrR family transcriptional regulator